MNGIETVKSIRILANHLGMVEDTNARGTTQYVKVYTKYDGVNHDMAITVTPIGNGKLKICIGMPRYNDHGFDRIQMEREELTISPAGEIKYERCRGSSRILDKHPKWLLDYEKNGWTEIFDSRYENMKWIRLVIMIIDQWDNLQFVMSQIGGDHC